MRNPRVITPEGRRTALGARLPAGRARRCAGGLMAGTLCVSLSASAWAQASVAERLYQEGLAARLAGLSDTAIERFERLVELEPSHVDARLQLGLALAAARRYAAAKTALRQVLDQAPDYDDARLALARIAFWQGDLAAAERELQALRRRSPNHVEAKKLAWQVAAAVHSRWLEEARTLRRRKHYAEAERVFRAMIERQPRDADLRVDLGVVLTFQGRLDEARDAFGQALALDPRSIDAAMGLIRVDYYAGEIGRAQAGIQRILAVRPDDPEARSLEARLLLAQGDAAAAERAFGHLAAAHPRDIDPQIGLGDSLRVQERDEEAREAYSRASLIEPGAPEVLDRLALKPRPRWRIDIDGSLTRLTDGLAPWREGRIALAYRVSDRITLATAIEVTRRFGHVDTLVEGRIDYRWSKEASSYLRVGGTPDADVRPDVLVEAGGAVQVAPGSGSLGPTVATLDVGYAHYRTGDVKTGSPGLQQYLLDGRVWLTARAIGTVSETGRHLGGYLVRADWLLAERWNLFFGYADAPTTDHGSTVETQALFGGVSVPLDPQTSMRISASREDQNKGYDRSTINVGLTSQF